MWEIERNEHWANLSGGSGMKTYYVGVVDMPEHPKEDDIRRTVNEKLAGTGFKIDGKLDLSMRSIGVIMGDLVAEPETRVLDVFNADSFSMTWIPGTVEENLKRSKLWRNQMSAKGPAPELSLPETEPERKPLCHARYARNQK